MPADADAPRRRRVLSKDRMEGFSDGVFGFAITLLVVDIALRGSGTPLQQVLNAWPSYLTGGLVLPVLAVALYFGIAVYLVVPFREAARLLHRRS